MTRHFTLKPRPHVHSLESDPQPIRDECASGRIEIGSGALRQRVIYSLAECLPGGQANINEIMRHRTNLKCRFRVEDLNLDARAHFPRTQRGERERALRIGRIGGHGERIGHREED